MRVASRFTHSRDEVRALMGERQGCALKLPSLFGLPATVLPSGRGRLEPAAAHLADSSPGEPETFTSSLVHAAAVLFLLTVMVLALPIGLLFLLHWLVRSSGRFAMAAVRAVLNSSARAGDRLILLYQRSSRDPKTTMRNRKPKEVKPAVNS
jgi:hypothetical protein